MKKNITILPPLMPNFALTEDKEYSIPIGEFTPDEAYEYAELMKQTFIKHWEKKSKPDLDNSKQ